MRLIIGTRLILLAAVVNVYASPAVAQGGTAARRPNSYHTPPPPTEPARSFPEVHADRTITFRIAAPAARAVTLRLDGDRAMTKDADGNWSITIDPLVPELYEYSFVIDGAKVLDGPNPLLKTGDFATSLVDVPAVPPRFDQVRDVAHGSLHVLNYTSTPFKKFRSLYVYVPPQYDREPSRRFPVLYLRHGNGDDEAGWSIEGRAGVILENLIADGKAVPMLIVMPYGESNAAGGGTPQGYDALYRELEQDIIPLVEGRYRVRTDRESRAIAGLSMGGGQAFTMGLQHLDRFAWVGEFSSGVIGDVDFRIEKHLPSLVTNTAAVNEQLRLLFLSCGTEDPRLAGHLNLVDELTARKLRHVWYSTPGAHEFKVWRHSLHEFLPLLFQPTGKPRAAQ